MASLLPWGWIISVFVFIGLLVWLFELDTVYVVILTIISFLLTLAVTFAIASMNRS